MVYLDNAATTKPSPSVIEKATLYIKEEFGNASSIHSLGIRARQAVDSAREQVAKAIGAEPHQIIFTSGGTEANNLAITGMLDYIKGRGRTEIVTSCGEHESVIRTVENVCMKLPFHSHFLPINSNGSVEIDNIIPVLSNKTGLVSLMYVNNEVGAINPVEEIARECRNRGIVFHTDCVQALGTSVLDINKIGCDMMSLSSHKIRGFKGTGALFVRTPALLTPSILGGANQEFGLRSGTENIIGIVAFGQACEEVMEESKTLPFIIASKKSLFLRTLTKRLHELCILDRFHDNAKSQFNPSKILSFRFDGIDSETLILMLSENNIFVSAGSACHSAESTPSRVLLSLGLSPEQARNSIRISLSGHETDGELELAARTIAECVKVLLSTTSIDM